MARLVTWLKGMLSVSLAVAVLFGCSDGNGDSDGGGTPPAITSTPPTTATAGTPYTYTITATGNPAPSHRPAQCADKRMREPNTLC